MPGSDPRERIVISPNQDMRARFNACLDHISSTTISPVTRRRMRGTLAAQLFELGLDAYERQLGVRPPVAPAAVRGGNRSTGQHAGAPWGAGPAKTC
ncbi:MAG: hypothetical protein OXI73_03600, partial [Rhodospirillales bacterium]|nr:hypothetical protein [Rhodospirillales bacterium]